MGQLNLFFKNPLFRIKKSSFSYKIIQKINVKIHHFAQNLGLSLSNFVSQSNRRSLEISQSEVELKASLKQFKQLKQFFNVKMFVNGSLM